MLKSLSTLVPWSSGKKRRRGWRKLHLSIDNEGRIRSSCVSKWYTQDGQRASHLLQQIKEPIASFTGDKVRPRNSLQSLTRTYSKCSNHHPPSFKCRSVRQRKMDTPRQACSEDTRRRCVQVEKRIEILSTKQSGEYILSV